MSLNATIGLSTKTSSVTKTAEVQPTENLGSLGLYVHIDVTPIIISVSEAQMRHLASLVYGLADFFDSISPKTTPIQKQTQESPPIVTVNTPSLSPTVDTGETTHDLVTDDGNEGVKLTAWVQWTITKFSLELLANQDTSQMKFVVDIEDIVSSLDYQSVYLKLKKKIGSISIQHLKRSSEGKKWKTGDFSGVVLRLRDDVPAEKRPDESGFFGMTLTRASSQHTHNLWGAKSKEKKTPVNHNYSRYLTEVVVTVQPIDVVLSFRSLMPFYSIFLPFMDESLEQRDTRKMQWFNNQSLPLAYLECSEIRVIVPSSDLHANKTSQLDVYVMQIEKITLSPSVTNPICRTPLRPDIYRQAAQARVLAIPGSELEDRQYQVDVLGTSLSTAMWKDLDQVLNMRGHVAVRGINENPALEWNKLSSKKGKLNIAPILNLQHIVEK